jgi:16S rRNA (cytidine1402-2'-O)-methyltransferase
MGTTPPDERAPRGFTFSGVRIGVAAPPPGLHVVATPIGRLEDVTIRALKTLAGADVVACEDTRVTARLLGHYGIEAPLLPYHEHNAAAQRPKLLRRLGEGASVALVSDAGTPLVSDPGFRLVAEAAAAGHAVIPVPGASAVLGALVAAALPTDRFFFEGFLPAKAKARRDRLAVLASVPATLVVFESGPRLAESLADMADVLGPREAAVCRELTKLHETITRATLPELAAAGRAPPPKGEIVVVIGPPPEPEPPATADVDAALAGALARTTVKDAVAEVAAALGLPRREVYARALALKPDAGR